MYDIYNKQRHVPFCGAFYPQRLAQPLSLSAGIKAHADAQINACILIKW